MKYLVSVGALVLVAAGIWYVASRPSVPSPLQSPTPSASAARSVAPSVAATPKTRPSSTPKETLPATPAVTPTPSAAAGTFTAAQVATHNSSSSCYSIIHGSVYDLTSYIPVHPGGPQRMLMICGKDGTSLFDGQHEGQTKVESILSRLKIGELAR